MPVPPPDAASKPQLSDPPPPLDGLPAVDFRERRDRLRAACSDGLVLVRGATEEEAHAAGRPYRQDYTFFHLTGVDTPGAFLVLLPEHLPASVALRDAKPEDREVLFLPARDSRGETWTGPKLGPGEETATAAGVDRTAEANAIWSALISWIRRSPVVYLSMPYGERAALTREHTLMQRLQLVAPAAQLRDMSYVLSQLRTLKTPAEIERIREAVNITKEGQRAARRAIARGAGKCEYEVEAEVLRTFRSQGASLGFPCIVGAGRNATVLHYEDNNCAMVRGDAVVVDIGAARGHYTGDITRTYPVGGRFSRRQREIYELVLSAHRNVISTFKPGEDTLRAINDRCKEFLKESPLRAKDADGNKQTMEHFMPHGLGHFLGLYVHDSGDSEPPLAPGAVITVEPGVYVPSEGIGVRLEDDYLVTENGLELLGDPLEIGIEELEKVMAAERR